MLFRRSSVKVRDLARWTMMRRSWLAILGLAACTLTGCFLIEPVGKAIRPGRLRPADGLTAPDAVYVDVHVLVAPVGDRYVNEEIWTEADEQVLSAESRVTARENGLRVGMVTGRSDKLLELITSKRSNPNPRRRVGNPIKVALASDLPICEFALQSEGEVRNLRFEKATCQLQIVPTLESDGKVRLQFTPQVEFDDDRKWSRLDPNVALAVQGKRSTESLTALRWEVSLGADEYVVIGTRFDRLGTLGFQAFVTVDPERPIQRLVAIRVGRFGAGAKPAADAKGSQTPPLASQAGSK